jgi:hypothetical protein
VCLWHRKIEDFCHKLMENGKCKGCGLLQKTVPTFQQGLRASAGYRKCVGRHSNPNIPNTNTSAKQLTDRPNERTNERTTDRSTAEPTDQPNNQPTYKSNKQPARSVSSTSGFPSHLLALNISPLDSYFWSVLMTIGRQITVNALFEIVYEFVNVCR